MARWLQVELRKWEVKRKEMRGKLMQEEATTEARRRIANIEAQGKNRLSRWFSRYLIYLLSL